MLPPGWIEVHGWPWDYNAEERPERFLVQARHVHSLVPLRVQERLLTVLVFGQYAHTVEESVGQVQELMVQALRQT